MEYGGPKIFLHPPSSGVGGIGREFLKSWKQRTKLKKMLSAIVYAILWENVMLEVECGWEILKSVFVHSC